ncbi:beta-galactosidase [Amphibacillus jilinensis]|uniref:beta-galactosidase n=1 Tax=Amphibacillus jilinensis TaxID=1216008 RepID=UPI0002FFE618|nr:beta-galactosidase [Amphibacillus jilinensis]
MEKIYYGAALYPELWEREIIKKDIKHMKRIGMNLARIGEFTWSTFEPKQDQFDFTVLIETLDDLAEHQMDVIVCTPTPTPPVWMTDQHPERLHQNQDRSKMYHGSRQHICTNQPFFRKRAAMMTERLIKIVARYDHVIAVQLDNEFKCHIGPCYCQHCKALWTEWLHQKYADINVLNQAWGTDIWSQRYLDFAQVVQPLPTPFLHNSSLLQNYLTFTHDKIAEFALEQANIIRSHVDIPVTHNSSMFFDLDNEKFAKALDFISFDTYTPADKYPNFMINQERWKYIKNDTRKFMLLETSNSYNGHIEQYGKLHESGYVEAESFAAYAAGSQAFTYWLFRGQRSGCEQPHGSVVSAWGDPTIGYQNVLDVNQLINKITPYLHKTEAFEPRVALTYSDHARAFINVEPGENNVYKDLLNGFYKHFLDLNIPRKVVPEGHDLNRCDLLFTPYAHHISDHFLSRLQTFIENGGVWVAGPMTGDRTAEHTWPVDGGLGPLTEWAGIKAMMQFSVTDTGHYGAAFGHESELTGLSSFFEVEDNVKVHGEVIRGQAKGQAFFIEKTIGKGKLVILGTTPDSFMMKAIINHYAQAYKIDQSLELANQIIAIPRQTKDQVMQYWIVNFSNQAQPFHLHQSYKSVLNDRILEAGEHMLAPFGYGILKK